MGEPMLRIGQEEEMEFTKPTQKILDMIERILYMNETALNMVIRVGEQPMMVKLHSPELGKVVNID